MSEFSQKNILVAGLGKSGLAALRLLAREQAGLYAWDAKKKGSFSSENLAELERLGVVCFFEGDTPDIGMDMVVTSPGLPLDAPVLMEASERGVEIIGELELAYRLSHCPFIAITGTNGKTTTTSLVGDMFRLAGAAHAVVGNIGYPASDAVLHETGEETMITEVSSFQLETIADFRPRIAALLNVAPDHLDRHGSLEEYKRIKFRLFQNQTAGDACVYNADDPLCAELLKSGLAARAFPFSTRQLSGAGAFVQGSRMVLSDGEAMHIDLGSLRQLKLLGTHNISNALAAAAVAYIAGVPVRYIRESLRTFAGLPHRFQHVADIAGVSYIDDSKGTNPAASAQAIRSAGRPIVLIAGGYEKQADFKEFTDTFPGRVRHVLLLGDTAARIAESAIDSGFPGDNLHFCSDMAQCVAAAKRLSEAGDIVLLSPACASWGMYSNFEERGLHFQSLVHKLASAGD